MNKKEQDLRKWIRDWYKCPLCGKVVAGFMSWASHTAQEHGMDVLSFTKKYGKPKKSYYGIGFEEEFNPSQR